MIETSGAKTKITFDNFEKLNTYIIVSAKELGVDVNSKTDLYDIIGNDIDDVIKSDIPNFEYNKDKGVFVTECINQGYLLNIYFIETDEAYRKRLDTEIKKANTVINILQEKINFIDSKEN